MTGLCLSRVNISFNILAMKANEALSCPTKQDMLILKFVNLINYM